MAARIYILRCWPLSPAHCSFTIQHVIQFIYRSSDTGTQYSTVQYSTVQYSDTVYIPIIWYRNTTRSDICPGPDPCHEYLHSTVLPSTHATNVTTAVWRLKAVFADSKAWCFQRHNFFKRQIKWLKCAEWLMIIYWNCKYCSCSAAGPGGVLRTPESPVSSQQPSKQPSPKENKERGSCGNGRLLIHLYYSAVTGNRKQVLTGSSESCEHKCRWNTLSFKLQVLFES